MPPELDLVTFGQRLRHHRLARGLTLAELGRRVGRAPSALSALENGRREPRLSLLRSLADALEITTEELLAPEPPNRRATFPSSVQSQWLKFTSTGSIRTPCRFASATSWAGA